MAEDETKPAGPDPVATPDTPSEPGETARTGSSVRRTRPTRRQDGGETAQLPAHERKAGPGEFVGQSVEELKKVVWPTKQQMASYFVLVLIFVTFIMLVVSLMDTGLGWLVLRIFGE